MRKRAAHVRGSAVAIVRQALDVHADTGRTITLVGNFLEVRRIGTRAKGLVNRDLDLVLGHGIALGLGDGCRQGGVVLGIGIAAGLRCDGNDTAELGEHRPSAWSPAPPCDAWWLPTWNVRT